VAEGVKPVHAPDGLIDELASADVVVTAAGVTLLESLALGRPTIAIQRATNQRRYFEALTRASAAVGSTVGAAARDAARLTRYPARRRELSRTAREHVDGDGARRVARAIIELD
jgi:spore coat polysaccharide biosynthesis predicted glycosyltransferase SpsG